jgi:Domain of unknown function (DUF4288)
MWFAVSLLYESVHSPEQESSPLWEESVRIFDALNQDDAIRAGEEFGRKRSNVYSVDDSTVTWIFRGVQNAFPIEHDHIEPGDEVFSRFLRDSEARSFLQPFLDDE